MIKMVAIDLDGTMYNSKKIITQEVIDSIHRIIKAGIQPAIITGRGKLGSEMAIHQLKIDMPYICSAGALIRSGMDGEVLRCRSFHSPSETNLIIEHCQVSNIGLLGESLDGTMIWHGSPHFFHGIDEKTRKEIEVGRISQDPKNDFNIPMLKLTLSVETTMLEEVKYFIEAHCPSLHPVISGAHYIDITAQGVNKGTGLRSFAEMRGFKPNEIAAIGDQEIDLFMMEYAGLSIAMENGVQKVKDAAIWIAPSNDEHGVAWALDRIIQMNTGDHVH
jgi:Cof subfamily protein (haloacid dehalogenase superfamily)